MGEKKNWLLNFLGAVLILVGIVVLSINESQSFNESKDLEEVSSKIISFKDYELIEDNEGKVIHIIGKLEFPEPIVDTNYSIEVKAMELSSSAEMYQWIESSVTHTVSLNHTLYVAPLNQTSSQNQTYAVNQTSSDNQTYYYNMTQTLFQLNETIIQTNYTYVTYHYAMDWSSKLVNSRYFNISHGHKNPEQIPIKAKFVSARKIQINRIVLGDAARALIRGSFKCSDVISDKSPTHPQIKQHLGWYYHVEDRRDIRYPLVGDVREKFQQCGVEGDTFSIIGNLINGTLLPFDTTRSKNVIKVVKGELAVEEMFQGDHSAVSVQTWLLRVLGFLIILIGVICVHTDFSTSSYTFLGPVKPSSLVIDIVIAVVVTISAIVLRHVLHSTGVYKFSNDS